MAQIVAYHGTASAFGEFCTNKSDRHPSKIGIWFASESQCAEIIAESAKRMIDDIPRVITARIALTNPAVFETYADYLRAYRDVGGSSLKLRRHLMRKGFDGVQISQSDTDGAGKRVDYAVFDLHQITIVDSQALKNSPNANNERPRARCKP